MDPAQEETSGKRDGNTVANLRRSTRQRGGNICSAEECRVARSGKVILLRNLRRAFEAYVELWERTLLEVEEKELAEMRAAEAAAAVEDNSPQGKGRGRQLQKRTKANAQEDKMEDDSDRTGKIEARKRNNVDTSG